MATYYYDMPVIVKQYEDEETEKDFLPVKNEVVQRVVESFNDEDLKQYSHDVVYKSLVASENGKKVRVTAQVAGRYSQETEEKIRLFLTGQCSDGWNENGIELSGRMYGYDYRLIFVYTWEYSKTHEFDVKTVKGAVRDES